MQASKILVPTDFSDYSEAAFDYAEALARDTGAKLLIIHVKDPFSTVGAKSGGYSGVPIDADSLALSKLLYKTRPKEPTIVSYHRLLTGDPAKRIVKYAGDENVDFIVMGTHGRSGLKRLLMGSVDEAVTRHASCPVLTIKKSTKEKKPVMA